MKIELNMIADDAMVDTIAAAALLATANSIVRGENMLQSALAEAVRMSMKKSIDGWAKRIMSITIDGREMMCSYNEVTARGDVMVESSTQPVGMLKASVPEKSIAVWDNDGDTEVKVVDGDHKLFIPENVTVRYISVDRAKEIGRVTCKTVNKMTDKEVSRILLS